MKQYKVLTLWEPWATLVVHGIKKIETRPKPTTWTVEKGSYLIHAAKKWAGEQNEICTYFSSLLKSEYITDQIAEVISIFEHDKFALGHIIGAVDVVECIKIISIGDKPFLDFEFDKSHSNVGVILKEIKEPELSFGDYKKGRYAWILKNPRILKTPIPYKGGQGYYQNYKGDVNQLKFK